MVLIDRVVVFDHKPNIWKVTDQLGMWLIALIIMENHSTPVPEERTQPQLVSDLLKKIAAPPSDERCSICLESEFSVPVAISCGHIFCLNCALVTLGQRAHCPICSAVPEPLGGLRNSTESESEIWRELWVVSWFVSGCACISLTQFFFVILLEWTSLRGWQHSFHYTTAFLALYPSVRNVLCTWYADAFWWSALVAVGVSVCAVAATYNTAKESMSRGDVFEAGWATQLSTLFAIACLFTVVRCAAFKYRGWMDAVWLERA